MSAGSKKPRGEARNEGLTEVTMRPIGVVRSPFVEKVSAPRQAVAARGVKATIELFAGLDLDHAVLDLGHWDHIWVIFWFHLNTGWKPKVLPPRSSVKRGVLATRSPHRPNPIGMSVVRLERVEGLVLHISDVDILDGTPVLDIKPYVPYADSVPGASTGWLDPDEATANRAEASPRASSGDIVDPDPGYAVRWEPSALEQALYLAETHALDVRTPIDGALVLGPEPHPYRRIKRDGDRLRLAWKSWRARFRVEGRNVIVEELASGYRSRELEPGRAAIGEPAELGVHRAFVARFSGDES